MTGIGDEFLQATKYSAGTVSRYGPLPQAPLAVIELPRPKSQRKASLAKLLSSRRSRRKFSGDAITLEDLSFLLWASDGVAQKGLAPHFRTAPSAGAKHPLDTYCIINRVSGVQKGLYRYRVESHTLELLRKGDFEDAAVKATAGQEWTRGSVAVFAWVAEFARTTARYKERGYRYEWHFLKGFKEESLRSRLGVCQRPERHKEALLWTTQQLSAGGGPGLRDWPTGSRHIVSTR